jgi:hypothetical protein
MRDLDLGPAKALPRRLYPLLRSPTRTWIWMALFCQNKIELFRFYTGILYFRCWFQEHFLWWIPIPCIPDNQSRKCHNQQTNALYRFYTRDLDKACCSCFFYPSDEWKILSMGLDCGSFGSSLGDHLFWLTNKVWRGISAWQEGYKRTSTIEICQIKDSGEVFNF